MEVTQLLLYVLAGAGVGFAVGVTGVGGGSLMTPLLLMFGFPPHVAVGTDLLYAAITKAGGAWAHHRQGHVDWTIARRLAIGSLPAALLTIAVLHTFFTDPTAYAGLIKGMLGVMLILTAAVLLFKKRLLGLISPESFIVRHAVPLTVLSGIVLGVCVTLSSVGAGAFGAAVLIMLFPLLTTARIVGTDIAHAVPLTLVAGLGHLWLGNVDFMLLGALLVGSLPAISLGARLTRHMPGGLLQGLLTTLLLVLGIRYAFF